MPFCAEKVVFLRCSTSDSTSASFFVSYFLRNLVVRSSIFYSPFPFGVDLGFTFRMAVVGFRLMMVSHFESGFQHSHGLAIVVWVSIAAWSRISTIGFSPFLVSQASNRFQPAGGLA